MSPEVTSPPSPRSESGFSAVQLKHLPCLPRRFRCRTGLGRRGPNRDSRKRFVEILGHFTKDWLPNTNWQLTPPQKSHRTPKGSSWTLGQLVDVSLGPVSPQAETPCKVLETDGSWTWARPMSPSRAGVHSDERPRRSKDGCRSYGHRVGRSGEGGLGPTRRTGWGPGTRGSGSSRGAGLHVLGTTGTDPDGYREVGTVG